MPSYSRFPLVVVVVVVVAKQHERVNGPKLQSAVNHYSVDRSTVIGGNSVKTHHPI